MAANGISNNVRQFIFDFIDSVEQLDVLIFLRLNQDKWWTSFEISKELRSSPSSVEGRMALLKSAKMIEENEVTPKCYRFCPQNDEMRELIDKLTEDYKQKQQSILQLIFSPLKKGRNFADAFMINPSKKEDDENG